MAANFTLRVITPDRIALDTTVDSIKVPALDGSMGILPRHAAMVAALDAGEVGFLSGGRDESLFVSGGFAEVRGATVRIVADAAERPSDIDVERADRAAERAKERLRVSKGVDVVRANEALRRALQRKLLARKR